MDQGQLKDLYEKHAPELHRYLVRLGASEEEAFDLMQDTFLRADRYHHAGIDNVRAWLYKIAYHLFVSERKRASRDRVARENLPLEIQPDSFTGDAHWRLIYAAIDRRLRGQDESLARMFVLRLDHDFSHQEIADILEVSDRTVRRGFEKIRSLLLNEFKNDLGLGPAESQQRKPET